MSKTVLVVEDEQSLIKIISKKLEINGFDSVSARTVDQALNYLKEMKIDAVWLDHYLLGKKSGLDLIIEIKKKEENKIKDIPIFVVSNTASSKKVKTYLNLGAEKYYTKSNHKLDDIIKDIKEHINN